MKDNCMLIPIVNSVILPKILLSFKTHPKNIAKIKISLQSITLQEQNMFTFIFSMCVQNFSNLETLIKKFLQTRNGPLNRMEFGMNIHDAEQHNEHDAARIVYVHVSDSNSFYVSFE